LHYPTREDFIFSSAVGFRAGKQNGSAIAGRGFHGAFHAMHA
jgi:hypothetical protein